MSNKLENLVVELALAAEAGNMEIYSEKVTEILTRDKTYYMALANISSGIIDKEHIAQYAKLVLEHMGE